MRDLTGKAALVTGGSTGIGAAVAAALLRRGVHVVITGRDAVRLDETRIRLSAIPAPRGDVATALADVRAADDMQRAVDVTMQQFGRLDILVANAGIGQRGGLANASWGDLDTVLRTNIDGVLHSVRAAVPEMRKQGGGHIVVISSVVANMITPYTAVYSASKAAVSSIARALRYELQGDHIGVSDILVGRTATGFNEHRLGASGYAGRAPRLPVMTPEFVADGVIRAIERGHGTVTLRGFDHLIVWAAGVLPHVIARRALRQYR